MMKRCPSCGAYPVMAKSCEEKQTPAPWPRASQQHHREDVGFSSWWPPRLATPHVTAHGLQPKGHQAVARVPSTVPAGGASHLFSPVFYIPTHSSLSGHGISCWGSRISHSRISHSLSDSLSWRQSRVRGPLLPSEHPHHSAYLTQPRLHC